MNVELAFLGGLGGWEILLILLVLLIFFGAKKIPELAKGLGKGIKEFKNSCLPPYFTKLLADRLNSKMELTVQECVNGSVLQPGHVYIALGDQEPQENFSDRRPMFCSVLSLKCSGATLWRL